MIRTLTTMMSSVFSLSLSCAPVARPNFAASRQHLSVSAVVGEAKAVKAKAPKPPKKEAPKEEDDRIKRAPSAVNLYFKTAMPALRAKSPPGTKITELTGALMTQWKGLAPEVKAPFEAESQALKAVVASKR